MDELDLQAQIQNALPQGVKIEECKDSAYLKTYLFSTEKDGEKAFAYINFYYNAQEKITRIRPKENSEFAKNLCEAFGDITQLYVEVDEKEKEYEFPKKNLRDLFDEIKANLKDGIVIDDLENLPYRQRYTFKQGKSRAVFDFIYDKNGEITGATSMPKYSNSSELVEKLRGILNEVLNKNSQDETSENSQNDDEFNGDDDE